MMGTLYMLRCDEHNCGVEFPLMHSNEAILHQDAVNKGWRVNGNRASCPNCFQQIYANCEMPLVPEPFGCRQCGVSIFGAYICGKFSYWNSQPTYRGHRIAYPRSMPQRIMMNHTYVRKGDASEVVDDPLFVSHRCKKADIQQHKEFLAAATSNTATTWNYYPASSTSSWTTTSSLTSTASP